MVHGALPKRPITSLERRQQVIRAYCPNIYIVLEGLHKFVRIFRLRLARFSNTRDNLKDVFKRLWMKNTALIRKQHPKRVKRGKNKPKNADDKIVEDFIIE